MNTRSLKLVSRFSLPPNSLGYCGKKTAPAKLIDCVISGNCDGIKDELSKFIVLNPYLETLAEITGKDKFSHEVVEAYWLGNESLKKAKSEHYFWLLQNFSKQGVPEWLVEELKSKPPKVFIPMHLWQVLYVGVGRASGSVPYNLETINNCMIRWGKVIEVFNDKLKVELNSLENSEKKKKIITKIEEYGYRKDFLGEISKGQQVAVHWKQVVKRLTTEEEKNLSYWTNKVIESVD